MPNSRRHSLKLKQGDLVEVTWVDCNSPYRNEWATVDDFCNSTAVMEIHSVGYFLQQKSGYLRMAADVSKSNELETVVNRPLNIPRGVILHIRRIA